MENKMINEERLAGYHDELMKTHIAGGCVFDISAYHATGTPPVLATYADLAAALGTNGANVPESMRKGGMSVKFVSSIDHKYVQFRYMPSDASTVATFTNVANWQGVDAAPTEGSHNLIESGGVFDRIIDTVNQFADVNIIPYLTFINKLLNKTTGDLNWQTADNRRATVDYISVREGQKFKTNARSMVNFAGICYYDSEKSLVSAIDGCSDWGVTETFTVPSGCSYMRICTERYSTQGLTLVLIGDIDAVPTENSNKFVRSGGVFQAIEEVSNSSSAKIDNVEDRIDIMQARLNDSDLHLDFDTNGYLNNDSKTPGSAPNRKYTSTYYKVLKGDILEVSVFGITNEGAITLYKGTSGATSDWVAGYNSTTATGQTMTFTVPQDGYVRFSNNYTKNTSPFAKYIVTKELNEEIDALNAKVDDEIDALNAKVDAAVGKENYSKPYFDTDRDLWIEDETTKTFYPIYPRIEQKYTGEVTPEKRYIALGFDDFRETDFSLIIPLLDKYGAKAEFNRVHNSDSITDADITRINSIINSRHELGDHTWKHLKYPFDEPLMNGQDPSSPEGNQVPFPSNDQLRNDAGDGKNVFGRTLTNNVKTDIGYQAPDIDTTWAAMTDAQCQQLRDYFSVMKDTSTNLITLLDTLSNTYLGTTGSSRGSWDSVNEEYTGGIFTGCKTSQNHEIWERILLVTNMFLKDKFGLNYNLMTWSLPGSKNSGCTFLYNNSRYYDAEHTKRVGNLARFASSLYKNNDNTAKERSWTDVLREFGYRTTHDASPTTRGYCMMYQFIMNASQSRPDALPHPTNRLLSYSKMASEYIKGTDLTGTAPYEVQMYDGGAVQGSTKTTFRNEIEQWRHSAANGIIWGAVIDSQDTWSERMILEGLLKYGANTGIEFVTHAEAYDICFNHHIKSGNLIYNPRLRNTAKEFMPSATSVPSNPDGYRGDCSVSVVNGTPVLITTGETDYRHYGIPYGKVKYSAEVKGSGSINIRVIKNSTNESSVKTASISIDTINISNGDYAEVVSNLIIPDNGIGVYEDLFAGYGEKIIGLMIIYSSGLEIKNIDLRTV